jgi:hypothetical protein
MQIQEAIGDIGVPRIAELASEAPTLAGDEIVAACIHEAEEPPGPVGRGNESVKVLAVRNDGTLLMISWTGADYTGERVPRRNVARMRIGGTRRFDGAWARLLLEIELLRHEGQDDAKVEFRPMPMEALGEHLYRTERDAGAALMKVAEALSERL